ncbi:hypothetical protein J0H58_34425 [bacterium]|nr:hypothetical protein [bacterium]
MQRRTKWLAAGAAAVGLGPWLPGWLSAAGLDAWNTPSLRRQVAANEQEADRLSGQINHVTEQILAKERLAAELIAGRVTLADAAAEFETMMVTQPQVAASIRAKYPDAATDRERAARHVIDFANLRLADPAARDRLAVRMSAELEVLFPTTRPAAGRTVG